MSYPVNKQTNYDSYPAFNPRDTATGVGGSAELHAQRGVITTEALTTISGSSELYVLNNRYISANSIVLMAADNGSNTAHSITIGRISVGAGSASFRILNTSDGVGSAAVNGTVVVRFFVYE